MAWNISESVGFRFTPCIGYILEPLVFFTPEFFAEFISIKGSRAIRGNALAQTQKKLLIVFLEFSQECVCF